MTTDACSYATIAISATRMTSFPKGEMVRSRDVADLLIFAKMKGDPKEIAFYQDLYDRQGPPRYEFIPRADLDAGGYTKSDETPHTRVSEISSSNEIINEIKDLRSKDYSKSQNAEKVRLKYLEPYSPDQITQAYRVLDAEERQEEEPHIDTRKQLEFETDLDAPSWQKSYEETEAEGNRQESLSRFLKDTALFPLTQLGNSYRFVRRYGKKMDGTPISALYCYPEKTWHVWDGARWKADGEGQVIALAKDVMLRLADEAKEIEGDDERAKYLKFAGKCQARYEIKDMLALAESDLALKPENMDKDGNLLNFENGTLELDTFTFREHRKEDLLTKIAGCRFDKERTATCPEWEKHLLLIFNDQKFVEEFQQLCGYSLLADNSEQVFFVLHGAGKNGKSVTIQVLRSIFGEYGGTVSSDTITARKFTDGGTPRSDIMDLPGKRILITSETDETTVLNEAFIKAVTGGDTLKHRGLYQSKETEIRIGAKLWYATNHKPVIRGTDEAIWRRVWLIPFEIEVPAEKRVLDYDRQLLKEAPGILNWMLEGLQKIYDNGGRLKQPDKIKIASAEYRNESDRIGRFISERLKFDKVAVTDRKDLFDLYEEWCKEEREISVKPAKFYAALRSKTDVKDHSKTGNTKYMSGIRIKKPGEEGDRTL